ncbi:signal peptidase II [Candidatus Woesearchaeota archaeon]|nr:signal peptidase II [Candidatus Woesearchaeota archaeon]
MKKSHIFLFFSLLALDLITKHLLVNKIIIINKYLLLNYQENTGIAFSLLRNQNFFIIIITIFIIGFLIYYYKNKRCQLGIIFILAGAIGNLINRIHLGYVIDFIQISIWPVFNLADVFNIIGIIILFSKLKS